MSLYSCTISTTPANANGETTTSISSERINDHAGSVISSEDFASTGPTVLDGQTGARRSVLSEADLQPTDIIEVAGIPMTVVQARAAGVKVSVDSAASEAVTPKAPGAESEAAETVDDRKVDDGRGTDAEIVAMDNVVAAVAMHTGLDQEAAIELGRDILTGELAQDDVIWTGLQHRGISKDAAVGSVQQVVSVGQAAAIRELGQADYDELSRLADNSAAIKSVVIDHGIKRMTGKTKNVTWKHVLALARQYARA
ncbi:hypothetical protein [Bradyrhizobium vignae]|uniref:hypothetical protein n=1 Tax=Bradyrhizobium vignae TaxID=1549949 RepID=UPI00100B124F|nr:hypothetical protein [Bradyrhizobium vignae]RXH06303.1 hypothetical protein EAV90_03870 [Bradyrhizobium vignae]